MVRETTLTYNSVTDMYECPKGKSYSIEQAELLQDGGIVSLIGDDECELDFNEE